MPLNRNTTLIIHFILDQLLPPIIRDNRLVMKLLLRLALGRGYLWFIDFKGDINKFTEDSLKTYYINSSSSHIQRPTDLNPACVEKIENLSLGRTVLDIACGRGYLAKRLSRKFSVTGADYTIPEALKRSSPDIQWDEVNIERLHYGDNKFDTVICTHTLEHVFDIHQAIRELRRVTKKRLIVVLPRQRPYQYTFDLHVHFFPYSWQVELLFGINGKNNNKYCELVNGDWLYVEEFKQ